MTNPKEMSRRRSSHTSRNSHHHDDNNNNNNDNNKNHDTDNNGNNSKKNKDFERLDHQLRDTVNDSYFQDPTTFRPLIHIIKMVANARLTKDTTNNNNNNDNEIENNNNNNNMYGYDRESIEASRNQLEYQGNFVNECIDTIIQNNYEYLNNNVEGMGSVLRKFDYISEKINSYKDQISEGQATLHDGFKEQGIQKLWLMKREAEHILKMMETLEMLRNTPRIFDSKLEEHRYFSAVCGLKRGIDGMFAEQLVEVQALTEIRHTILTRKGTFLECIVKDLFNVLYEKPDTVTEAFMFESGNTTTEKERRNSMGSSATDLRSRGTHDIRSRFSTSNPGGGGGGSGHQSVIIGSSNLNSLNNNNMNDNSSHSVSKGSTNRNGAKADYNYHNFHNNNNNNDDISTILMKIKVTEEFENNLKHPEQEKEIFLLLILEAANQLSLVGDVISVVLQGIEKEVLHLGDSVTELIRCYINDNQFDVMNDDIIIERYYVKMMYAAFEETMRKHILLCHIIDKIYQEKGMTFHNGSKILSKLWNEIQNYLVEQLTMLCGSNDTDDIDDVMTTTLNKASISNLNGSEEMSQVLELSRLSSQKGTEEFISTTNIWALVKTNPYFAMSVYRPSMKFEQGIFLRVHQSKIGFGTSSFSSTALIDFLSDFVKTQLLTIITTDTNAALRKVMIDKDFFVPSTNIKMNNNIPPNKGAVQIFELVKPIAKFMTQLPQHATRMSNIMQVILESFISKVRQEFHTLTNATLASQIMKESWGIKYKELCKDDPLYQLYKTFHSSHADKKKHGNPSTVFSSVGNNNESNNNTNPHNNISRITSSSSSSSIISPPHSPFRSPNTSMPLTMSYDDDIADEFFERLVQHQKTGELWNFTHTPYRITRERLLMDKTKLGTIISLAHSTEWLAHKIDNFRINNNNNNNNNINSNNSNNNNTKKRSNSNSPKRNSNSNSNSNSNNSNSSNSNSNNNNNNNNNEWLDTICETLKQLAEEALLFVRLESEFACFHSLRQLSRGNFKDDSTKVSNTEVQQSISILNRFLLSLQDAAVIAAPFEFFAYVTSSIPRLLPKLLIHSIQFIKTRISNDGGDRLSRAALALQQTVPIIMDGMTTLGCTTLGLTEDDVNQAFTKARRYIGLIELDERELECYIKGHQQEFHYDEFKAMWYIQGPTRIHKQDINTFDKIFEDLI